MGLCKSLFRTGGYIFVALIAVLAYFHIQCEKEKAEKAEQSIFDKFDPKVTDVEGQLGFCHMGEKVSFRLV